MNSHLSFVITCIVLLNLLPSEAPAAELTQLSPDNYAELVPAGKEVDSIYGDYLLRNDRIVAVIACPLPTRNANMTVRGVGGMLIDLTSVDEASDQLSAYYCTGVPVSFTSPHAVTVYTDDKVASPDGLLQADVVAWQCEARSTGGTVTKLRYTLRDGDPFLQVDTIVSNSTEKAVKLQLSDQLRADRTFSFGNDASNGLFHAEDDWFRQAYGVLVDGYTIKRGGSRGAVLTLLKGDVSTIELASGEEHRISRRIFPGNSLLQVKGLASQLTGAAVAPVSLEIQDPAGPVEQAKVTLLRGDRAYASGRTDAAGALAFLLPTGSYQARIEANGRPTVTRSLDIDSQQEVTTTVEMAACGYVVGKVTDRSGGPIPCKVAFYGRGDTPDPEWGPDSAAVAVMNLHYSHTGTFRQAIGPGKYEAVISFGPEYDAVFRDLEVQAGEETEFEAKLDRVVDTTGWVSSDYHSHSSPSGDNTSSQLGRVLNLLCEHVEFAPCTEHNRVDTYVPHLSSLGVSHLMATCSGMELTGSPLPVNHQNAFPLHHHPHTQDGGGPQTDANPIVQIERLALWDNGSDKLVQENHPNLVQILGDRDLDQKPDDGFREMFGFMDVIEVHPPELIFQKPERNEKGELSRNPIFHWMQLLNLGYRIPGVVNTDAHYNFHGSGWIRNYLHSSTDDPQEIDTMEMVHASEHGHVIMTTGPFMEVTAKAGDSNPVIPGDDLNASDGLVQLSVRVQCSNWLDVNRVQVFVNGRASESLNFTRRQHPDAFRNQVVKFERTIPVQLERDAHLIVAAIGEGLQLGRIMGPTYGTRPPVAVSNPIFVDVDGGGFKANGDDLDLPLPYESGEPSPAGR